jgi:hypothetical protein
MFQLETNQEALVTTLEIGNHFAVVVDEGNNEGSNFWIFIWEEPLHVVEEEKKNDNWGQVVYKGEQIVIRRYYKQRGRSPTSYVLCDGGSAIIYSHFIFVTKFSMQVASHYQKVSQPLTLGS